MEDHDTGAGAPAVGVSRAPPPNHYRVIVVAGENLAAATALAPLPGLALLVLALMLGMPWPGARLTVPDGWACLA
ncbi:hypothetical protein [Mesorhizobium sanjuanii]|uniref:hypothetical protein n=1 Tax=Mesorhizobium sanjuanii TaxID=2037900 RepID=UPI0013FE2874|nr:hypothetical protein [Mesorhizobium sanjuanii]